MVDFITNHYGYKPRWYPGLIISFFDGVIQYTQCQTFNWSITLVNTNNHLQNYRHCRQLYFVLGANEHMLACEHNSTPLALLSKYQKFYLTGGSACIYNTLFSFRDEYLKIIFLKYVFHSFLYFQGAELPHQTFFSWQTRKQNGFLNLLGVGL